MHNFCGHVIVKLFGAKYIFLAYIVVLALAIILFANKKRKKKNHVKENWWDIQMRGEKKIEQ